MSDFKDSIDWSYMMQRLQVACLGQPLELQLLWLFEILSIFLFLKNKDASRHIIRLDKSYRLTHANMPILAADLGFTPKFIKQLADYRDTFVHFGYLEAAPLLTKFFESISPEELGLLQQVTGVTLNMRNSLV